MYCPVKVLFSAFMVCLCLFERHKYTTPFYIYNTLAKKNPDHTETVGVSCAASCAVRREGQNRPTLARPRVRVLPVFRPQSSTLAG
jgi:hypothetical protein